MGRIRLARITDTSTDSLLPFIEEAIEAGSVVYTDGHKGYKPLARAGYLHEPTSIWTTGDPGHVAMPRVHRVSSLLKRWLLGTHQGAVRPQQLDYYLDEFTFRFNRRSSNHRGLLFYRLLEQGRPDRPETAGEAPRRQLVTRRLAATATKDTEGNSPLPQNRPGATAPPLRDENGGAALVDVGVAMVP